MSLLSLSSITPSISELRDSDLSDGFTIVLPKSITPSTTKISTRLSAGLDKAKQFSSQLEKAKQRFGEGGFGGYKIGWDDELDRESGRERKREEKDERERRSKSAERRRSGSKERTKKRRSSSQDTLSSLSDGPELDLSSYTRSLNRSLKRHVNPRSPPRARAPVTSYSRPRVSKPVIPRRRSRSREDSVTSSSSSDEDVPVESTSESEVERIRETRARTPRAAAPTTAYIPHGRTDVLPALLLNPHSAFLAAYRLTHLTGPSSSPHSPSSPSFSPFNQNRNPTKPEEAASHLPLHLLPTFTPSEKRARRLALLLDSDDRAIRDWAMEEYVKLSSSGRALVSEGVFSLPVPQSRPSSPTPSTSQSQLEPESDFEDASVSEVGFGGLRRKRADTFQKAEDEERGRKLEALVKRLESTREQAEEREELERERAWASETFGRWMADGRADTVFREAASILDSLLKHMAREDGEEWALAPTEVKEREEESVRPSESASVAEYGERERDSQPTPAPAEGTITDSSGLDTQVTMMRAPAVQASIIPPAVQAPIIPPPAATPAPKEAPSPAVKAETSKAATPATPPRTKAETSKPAPATASKIPKLAPAAEPASIRDTAPEPKRRDSTKRDEKEKVVAPEVKKSGVKRDEGAKRDEDVKRDGAGKRDEANKREDSKRPTAPAPDLKRNDSSSRPPIKRADSNSKSKPAATPPAPALPIPNATPLPPKTPLKPHPPPQSTAQTNSQESQESGTSTIAAPPKPNFIPTTSSPAVPTHTEQQYESYADFYERDPRRARDDRPIRPHPAYANQFNGPSKPTPEQVFGTYADFYKGRSVVGSTVSRRSRRSDKDGKRKDKDRDTGKDKRRDRDERTRREREREPDTETLPHSILIRTQSPSLPRRSSKSKKPLSPSPEHDPLEDIAVSSRISLETGRLTTPGQSRAASPDATGRRPRARRRSSAGLTTPPQSRGPSPTPPPPPPPKATKDPKKSTKKSGKAQRLRGGAPSPSPPPIRRFGAVMPQPPPSEATEGPLIPLESDAGTAAQDASGEAAFGVLDPLPNIQFWMPPLPFSHHNTSSSDEDTDFPTPRPTPSTVFLALGARRACVPYTPAFTGLDTRVVRPVSARERLALRDAGAVLVRLGARVKVEGDDKGEGVGMWSLSYVGL